MLDINKEKCTGCYACQSICPRECISMRTDDEGFWYPHVDRERCISCGVCEQTCPALHTDPVSPEKKTVDAYAAYTVDEHVRQISSSGGVFTELVRWVISRGGVVFGAAMDETLCVVHQYAETEAGFAPFQGSKYVQSNIGQVYGQVRQFLLQGRLVLFTGTPCQISGLLTFLKRPYDNLITQDIACHGVPSPMVWKEYLKFQEAQAEKRIAHVAFRLKEPGWRKYSLGLEQADGSLRKLRASEDPYIRAFVNNLCLRPSCYQCAYKGLHRQSDITLADFWGVEKVCPEMDDDRGTSLVLVHSEKGKDVFGQLKDRLICRPVDGEKASVNNPSLVKASAKPENRDVFFVRIKTEPFDRVVNKMCPKRSRLKRIFGKIKRLIK